MGVREMLTMSMGSSDGGGGGGSKSDGRRGGYDTFGAPYMTDER